MESPLRPVWRWMAGGERPSDVECIIEAQQCLWNYYKIRQLGVDVLALHKLDDAISICKKLREEF